MKNTELMDEQKELQLRNNDLEQQLKELKLKSIDINNWRDWNYQQIIIWIMSLENGRFKKYEKILSSSLEEEEINGSHLIRVDAVDVKGWGIKNFDDKKDLVKYIQDLVNGIDNDNNIAAVADIEGGISGGHFK